MKRVESVMRRFAAHEFTIHQLSRISPDLREACEMLEAAEEALERWKADEGKVEEYRQIITELEAEILQSIARFGQRA